MKVLFLNTSYTFSFIARTEIISEKISVSLRNEMTNVVIESESDFMEVGGRTYLTLSGDTSDFKEKNKYEITLLSDGNLIYKGKAIILKEGTDVQNYEYGTQDNKFFK